MAKQDVTVWMEEYVYCALSECLPEGTSIEQELARMLERLYEQTVPAEERQKIEEAVRREEREADAEKWSRRRFVLIKVEKDGRACHLLTQDYRTPLEAVHACESCQPGAEGMDCEELAKTAFRNSFPLTREKFEEWCRMRGREVLAVYEIDLDENRMKASVMGMHLNRVWMSLWGQLRRHTGIQDSDWRNGCAFSGKKSGNFPMPLRKNAGRKYLPHS